MYLSFDFIVNSEVNSEKEFDAIKDRLAFPGKHALRAEVIEWLHSVKASQAASLSVSPLWRTLFSPSEMMDAMRRQSRAAAQVYGGLRRHGFMVAFAMRAPRPLIFSVSMDATSTAATERVEQRMKVRVDRCFDAGWI